MADNEPETPEIPPARFEILVQLLSSQALLALGLIPDPQGKTEVRFETEAPVKFLGWSASGKELYLARGKSAPTRPQPVELLKVQIESGATTIIHKFDSAYLYSPILSFDKQQIAVTTRREDTDNVEIVSIANGSVKRATNNSDTTTYYSGITWSPDGKILFYSKQQSWVLLSLIENSEK